MIDSAEASTSTVLLTIGIGRAYRLQPNTIGSGDDGGLQQRPQRVGDRHGPAGVAVDVDVDPMPHRGNVVAAGLSGGAKTASR